MLSSYLKRAYRSYAGNDKSYVRSLQRAVIGSRAAAKLLFKLETDTEAPFYFDLTTVLLRQVVKRRLRRNPDLRLFEMGTGYTAILCGYLSHFCSNTIDTAESDPARVASARRHVELNGVNVNVIQSNLFSEVPPKHYDVIFWNLPYYRDPQSYLPGLFAAAPQYMSPRGELIIGYNPTPLSRSTVLGIKDDYPQLDLTDVRTWWWNLHEVLILTRAGAAAASEA